MARKKAAKQRGEAQSSAQDLTRPPLHSAGSGAIGEAAPEAAGTESRSVLDMPDTSNGGSVDEVTTAAPEADLPDSPSLEAAPEAAGAETAVRDQPEASVGQPEAAPEPEDAEPEHSSLPGRPEAVGTDGGSPETAGQELGHFSEASPEAPLASPSVPEAPPESPPEQPPEAETPEAAVPEAAGRDPEEQGVEEVEAVALGPEAAGLEAVWPEAAGADMERSEPGQLQVAVELGGETATPLQSALATEAVDPELEKRMRALREHGYVALAGVEDLAVELRKVDVRHASCYFVPDSELDALEFPAWVRLCEGQKPQLPESHRCRVFANSSMFCYVGPEPKVEALRAAIAELGYVKYGEQEVAPYFSEYFCLQVLQKYFNIQ